MTKKQRGLRVLGLLAAVSAAGGCTSLLGLGGDFTVVADGGGGANGRGGSTSHGGGGAASTGGGGASSSAGGSGGAGLNGPISGQQTTLTIGPQHEVHDQVTTNFTEPGHVIRASIYGADGKWKNYEGTGTNDGNFEIDGVPDGPYLLRVDGRYAWLKERQNLDLAIYTTEWASSVALQNNPVANFDLTHMTGWADNDVLEVFAPAAGTYVFLTDPNALSPPFDVGATSVGGTAPWRAIDYGSGKLVTENTPVFIYHLGRFGSNPYTTLVDYKQTTIPNMVDDNANVFDVDADFAQVTQDQSFHLRADVPAFAALTPEFNPRATVSTVTFDFQAIPVSTNVDGQVGPTADLALYQEPAGAALNKTFYYGNPFSSLGWDVFASFSVDATYSVKLPNCGASASDDYSVAQCELPPNDSRWSAEFEPDLTPAQDPKIDGHPFDDPTIPTLDSTTPLLSWTVPAKGVRDLWTVKALLVDVEVDSGGGGGGGGGMPVTRVQKTYLATTVHAVGDVTEIRIPEGLLAPDTTYVFLLTDEACAGCDRSTAPFTGSIPSCTTSVISEIFRTPPAP